MKKYIFALLLFMASCGPVYADRLDILESRPDFDYCSVVAEQFYEGARASSAGHAKVLKEVTPDIMELLEHRMPLPKSAMYIPEWNSLTEREKSFVESNVFSGWDEANKIGRPITEEEARKMGQTVFNKCMYDRAKTKRMNFIKTAALDSAVNPKQKRYFQCKEWLNDHIFIGKAVKARKDCDQLIQWTTETEMDKPRKEKILKLLNEACTAPDVQTWFDKYYDDCMGEYK